MKFFETSKFYTLKKSTYISLRWIGIISIENMANKLLEKVDPDSPGKYSIDFQPHERKVIVIS